MPIISLPALPTASANDPLLKTKEFSNPGDAYNTSIHSPRDPGSPPIGLMSGANGSLDGHKYFLVQKICWARLRSTLMVCQTLGQRINTLQFLVVRFVGISLTTQRTQLCNGACLSVLIVGAGCTGTNQGFLILPGWMRQ